MLKEISEKYKEKVYLKDLSYVCFWIILATF